MIKKVNKYSDREIVEGILRSDNDVLSYLYCDNYKLIRKLVITNSDNDEDVQELLQDGIIALYENVKEGKFKLFDNCLLKTYLYQVCSNKWNKILKQRNKTITLDINKLAEEAINFNEDESLLNDQQIQKLNGYFTKLGEKCKQILVFFYYEKLSMEEIAIKLGYTNADNAKNQKFKCLQKLKKMFGQTNLT